MASRPNSSSLSSATTKQTDAASFWLLAFPAETAPSFITGHLIVRFGLVKIMLTGAMLLLASIVALQVQGKWQALARSNLRDDTYRLHRLLAGRILEHEGDTAEARIQAWSDQHPDKIRFGRERLKENSGMWWDDDITLTRWIFNTSLLDTTVGVAQKFAELRNAKNELQDEEQDIARFFAHTRWQWRKGHYLGFLVTHGQGYGDQAEEYALRGQTLDEGFTDSLTWTALQADRSYFDWHSHDTFQYFASVAAVNGTDTVVGTDPSAPNGFSDRERDVSGWAADLGARAQLLDTPRWVVGAHGAVASGGGEPGESDAFQQTSLESNRSRFTGTRSQVPRFGEAIQPEWSNIRVLTFYTALSDRDTWDANLLYHRYWLSDENGAVRSDLVEPGFTGSSDDLGQSVDLVLGYYGDSASTSWAAFDVRLRGGVFMPGDAYGEDADDARHRVVVDVSKRF
mgnify:CR=1 FL=1